MVSVFFRLNILIIFKIIADKELCSGVIRESLREYHSECDIKLSYYNFTISLYTLNYNLRFTINSIESYTLQIIFKEKNTSKMIAHLFLNTFSAAASG